MRVRGPFTTKEDGKRDYRVSDDNKPWRDELGYWPETLRLCCSAVSKSFFRLRRLERLERLERFELPAQIGSQEVVRILIFFCGNRERTFLEGRRDITMTLRLRIGLLGLGRIKPRRR